MVLAHTGSIIVGKNRVRAGSMEMPVHTEWPLFRVLALKVLRTYDLKNKRTKMKFTYSSYIHSMKVIL